MAQIDNLTEQRIKDAASIVDVLGDFYTLHKKGTTYQCLCPFHNDRHMGSFVISPRKNTYSCYSCGAHGDSISFLMQKQGLTYPDALRWLAKKYSIDIPDDNRESWSERLNGIIEKARQAEARRLEQMAQVQTLYLPLETPRQMMADTGRSDLVRWLYSLPWTDEQRDRLPKMLRNYAVGVSRDGLSVFWQIDEQARVHTGKMMRYRPDGHRDKEAQYNFDWVHSKLFRQGIYDPEQYDYETCLFGQHLLPFCPEAQVNLVESEKTALIMATYYGGMTRNLWLATGGLQFFDRRHIQVLIDQGRDIVVYPDKDGSRQWGERVSQIISETAYTRLKFNPTALGSQWKPCDGPKADIADVTIRVMQEAATQRGDAERRRGQQLLADIIRQHPTVGMLVEQFDLEIITDSDLPPLTAQQKQMSGKRAKPKKE